MGKIHVLDEETINQIAAGEVIERPASVVKELMENAIDAKATAITVEIKEGGISFIRITDNGMGIPKDEVKTAFLRHATSKITSALDLLTVSSLGFRGEALSSIGAVAMVELVTKRKEDFLGTRYEISGGREGNIEDIGVPDGTTFIVRNLFFNTPARRKFLKTAATEAGYINDIVCRMAMAHPEISIRFINNGKHMLHTSGNGKLKDVIYTIYGKDIALNLLELNVKTDNLTIKGFIGKPVISRGNRIYENYFINGRYIKSSIINKAIEEGYRSFMMQHKYPFTAICFSINQELLDVNVHPAKMELRFRNAEEIFPVVINTIADALKERELIQEAAFETEKEKKAELKQELKERETKKTPEYFETNRIKENQVKQSEAAKGAEKIYNGENKGNTEKISNAEPKSDAKTAGTIYNHKAFNMEKLEQKQEREIQTENIRVSFNTETNEVEKLEKLTPPAAVIEKTNIIAEENNYTAEKKPEQLELFDDKLLSKESRIKHRIIGQVFETYWIVQFGDKMFIIDQHAAHEKVLYERTIKRLKDRQTISQNINPPIILSLSMREEEIVREYMDYFNELGYEIEEFGGREYAVRSVPFDLFSVAKKDLLMEIIDDLSDDASLKRQSDLILDRVATMSCKAAVKGNNKLSFQEANALIDELMGLDNPYNCPHGRPTIISMSKYELEKKFKRII